MIDNLSITAHGLQMCMLISLLVDWLIYGVLTVFESFNTELTFKKFSLVKFSFYCLHSQISNNPV